MKYWLMKTEPDQFSFDDLVRAPKSTECWDGVRNYQARNLMRDDMSLGDLVFIYHSRIADPAVVGIAEIVKEAYPDDTALDAKSPYADAKSIEKGESRWLMVDVKAVKRMSRPVTLSEMRDMEPLSKMALLKRGQRLSIQPVSAAEWKIVSSLGKPLKIK